MGKLRTRKTLIKRIKISSRGKFMRKKIGSSHLKVKLGSNRTHRKNLFGGVTAALRRNFIKMLTKVS